MPKFLISDSIHMKLIFPCLLFFALFIPVYAQNGLIKAMPFEDAETIAIQSIRRASGIRVKKIDFSQLQFNDSIELIKKDKYVRNCLDQDKLDCIFKHNGQCPDNSCPNGQCPDGKSVAPKPIDLAKLQTYLNEKCFPYKRLRLTDTLDFLGITDEFRLAALRRYIVRNVELGVLGIWGINKSGVAQPFILSGKQLEDITTATTVLDLAKTIQSSASLPFLSYGTAEMIVRDCRNKVTGFNDPLVIEKITNSADNQVRKEYIKISDDLKKGIENDAVKYNKRVDDFTKCIEFADLLITDPVKFKDDLARAPKNLKHFNYGVRSVRVIDNEGDALFYHLTEKFAAKLKADILDNGLTYSDLIAEIISSAGVPSSNDFIAARIVINSLVKLAEDRNPDKSKPLFQPLNLFKVNEVLCKLRNAACNSKVNSGDRVTSETALSYLNISPAQIIPILNAESVNEKSAYFVLDKNKRLVKIAQLNLSTEIKSETTIEEIIEIVSKSIK